MANHKIHLLTQCDLTVNGCDWNILVGKGNKIVLHCLTCDLIWKTYLHRQAKIQTKQEPISV